MTSHDFKGIFECIEAAVTRDSACDGKVAPRARENHLSLEHALDEDYFQEMVRVIFSSGLPAQLASERMHALDHRFSDYSEVANFDNQFVSRLQEHPAMVRHDRKIRRIIAVAKAFHGVVEEHGSFAQYLKSFGAHDFDSALAVRANLMRRFRYLGRLTSILFLVEVGYAILKPDRETLRVFARLRLIDRNLARGAQDKHRQLSEAQVQAVVRIGAQMANAVQKPIRYINEILVEFAQRPGAICTDLTPRCPNCNLTHRCRYTPKPVALDTRPAFLQTQPIHVESDVTLVDC